MRISELLQKGRPTVSFEFFPPKTESGREGLLRVIDRLAPISPDFVSVTYGAGGSTRLLSFDICCQVKAQTTGLVMAHLTGVCHTAEEIAAITDHLWDEGIVNVMALRGDRPKSLDPSVSFGEFLYGKELVTLLKSRRDFCIGSGCYPEGHTETPDITIGIEHLKQKVDAGCDFLVTQMFFDNDSYFRFVDLASRAGINVPIVAGIMPITGFSQLDKFENQFGARLPLELKRRVSEQESDEKAIEQVGIDWAAEQCSALIENGVPGIHFYTLNRSSSTIQVCRMLNLTGATQSSV